MKLGYILAAWALVLLVVAILLAFHLVRPSIVSGTYTAVMLFSLAVLGLRRRFRLLRAVNLVDPELRDRITHVPWLGSQGANTKREAEWLFGGASANNDVLEGLKSDMRWFLCFAICALVSIPIINVLSALLG